MKHAQRLLALAFFPVALLAFGAMPAPAQTPIYVDQDANGANDGTSWGDAYETLQKALNNAGSGDEIWIAEGVYYPDEGPGVTDNDENASFTITGGQDGLKVYGGFDGTESTRDARAPAVHTTVLSGDIDADNGGADNNKTADGVTPTAGDINGNNSHHVVILNGGTSIRADIGEDISSNTVLNGVTVTGGNANNSRPENSGGGVFCDGEGNDNECNPQITRVTFKGNRANDFGGALFNSAADNGTSNPTITNVTFKSNSTDGDGGALFNSALISGTSNPTIANVIFADNSASRGGAVYNLGNFGTSSPDITNAVFKGNDAGNDGGAIYNDGANSGTADPTITNTILWANSASGNGNEIYNNDASATINYSIVQGGDGGIFSGSGFSSGDGNLNKDPQFVGPDDLRLQGPGSSGGASPAIDAGDNTAISKTEDLGGNTRKQDVGSVTDTGNGTSPIVDMGAYESDGSTLPVELVSFEAQTTEDAVALTWRTAAETNNAGFAVQRQVEDGTWTKVGFVDSRAEGGTTSEPQSYRFADEGISYAADSLTYRLRQVDTDGSTTLSDAVTVGRGVQSVELLGTAPNPARSQTTIRYALPERTDVTIRLYDVLGRRVRTVTNRTAEGRHRTTVDVNTLSSGVYVLRLTAGGTTKTQKMTVVQ